MSEVPDSTNLYLTPNKVGETPDVRAAQLKSLLKHPGYKMLMADLKARRDSVFESLVRFNVRDASDVGFIIAMQVEARVLTSLLGGYDMASLVEEMAKEELSNVPKKQEGGLDKTDIGETTVGMSQGEEEEDGSEYRTPSSLL